MELYQVIVTIAVVVVMLFGIAWRARVVWRNGTPAERLSQEDEATLDLADRLGKSDPATGHRILDDHFEKKGEREDAERETLRTQASTSRASAEELRQRLLEDLEVWQMLLKDSRKKARKDTQAQKAVANLEQWEKETRTELAQVEHLIRTFNV